VLIAARWAVVKLWSTCRPAGARCLSLSCRLGALGRWEKARWRELWKSPQANQWDETARGTVGFLVIYETAILTGSASAWRAQEARYAAEALGLTPRSLVALGWRIAE
jgi:hypothetical protein